MSRQKVPWAEIRQKSFLWKRQSGDAFYADLRDFREGTGWPRDFREADHAT